MNWVPRRYTIEEVDWAGSRLKSNKFFNLDSEDLARVMLTFDNWRTIHQLPLHTIQVGLRRNANNLHANSLVSQRIKRQSSIIMKLRRIERLQLSKMQDIGGCRAVLPSVGHVRELARKYHKSKYLHELIKVNDYISQPKASGYRSYHLVYKYFSNKYPEYNGLRVEIQLRSKLQHIWATAVETVDTYTQQALKSSMGQAGWLRFFALVGSAFSQLENGPLVPDTPTNYDNLMQEIRNLAHTLNLDRTLGAYNLVNTIDIKSIGKDISYYIIVLDEVNMRVKLHGYSREEFEEAYNKYSEIEKKIEPDKGLNAVFVSVNNIRELKKAYPNYFLDTKEFLKMVHKIID